MTCFDLGLALLPEAEFASDLVSSGLEWFWTSDDPNRLSGYEPETRLLTRLSQEGKRAFLDDLRDYGNAEGRGIAMFGIRPDSQNIVQSPADLKNALHTFIAAGTGPVQAAYSREDDGDELLYVAWPLSEPVRQLLGSWLIRPDQIREILWADWSAWQTKWLEGAIAQLLEPAKP